MKKILVTGGAGFIGANFVNYMVKKYDDYHILNLDSLTYASDYNNIKHLEENANYSFIQQDITDKSSLLNIFEKHDIHGVFHLAAESHVDNSISSPEIFLKTNILGTYNLLEACKWLWLSDGNIEKHKDSRFLHVSTDEVYGTLGKEGLFSEKTPYAPNSPYSASKASSDFLVRAFHETYGLNVVTTNCSNNYGPMQHIEKLIPKVITNALEGRKIPVYGTGENVRDWLYVTDHCKGLDLAYHKGISGQTYNIGGRNEKTNNEIVEKICEILDIKRPRSDNQSYKNLIEYVQDRAGHDKRYAIDASKIENELGWKAEENFETGIYKTINWYLKEYGESL